MYRHVRKTDGLALHPGGGVALPEGNGQDVRGEADGQSSRQVGALPKAETRRQGCALCHRPLCRYRKTSKIQLIIVDSVV